MEHTRPLIVHGNGPSKIYLNGFGNYLARAWHPEEGCRHCKLGIINLENFKELPIVLLALFIEYPTPFLEEQLEKVFALDYPKKRMHLFVHNSVSFWESLVFMSWGLFCFVFVKESYVIAFYFLGVLYCLFIQF